MKRIWLLMLLCAARPSAAQSIDTIDMRAQTRFLASDLLEGRGTGTRGEHIAAQYIASELARIGAVPIEGKDFFLPIPLKRSIIDHDSTRITLDTQMYRSAHDFVWNTGGRGALKDFAGPLLFVGAADTAAVRRSGEARGRVVLIAGAMGAAATAFVPALMKAGATGVVLLIPDSATFNLYVRSRGDSRYFVDADVADPIWQADLPVVIAGPRLTRAILGDAVPAAFTPIEKTLRARYSGVVKDVESANVAGIIKGKNPRLANEYVVYSAHYDHLGISVPNARGDSIYNGFSDNAAGVSMLLAIGDAFRRNPPARSVMLLFFTGEERGLLGSSYFAAQPPIPLRRIKGLINLDAGAPSGPPIEWRIAGGAGSPLGATAEKVLKRNKWDVQLTAGTPNSDYWPFLARGVPAIFIIPGEKWENITTEQKTALRARWDRYHQAGDEWHPDFPFAGLKRYAEAALQVGRAISE
jgi:hypothetical protein